MLTEAAQLEMANLKGRRCNFPGECIDIALHYGDAAYGNIGSGHRLDFTAVGRDINILSRLELLCKDVGRPLLMTDLTKDEARRIAANIAKLPELLQKP